VDGTILMSESLEALEACLSIVESGSTHVNFNVGILCVVMMNESNACCKNRIERVTFIVDRMEILGQYFSCMADD